MKSRDKNKRNLTLLIKVLVAALVFIPNFSASANRSDFYPSLSDVKKNADSSKSQGMEHKAEPAKKSSPSNQGQGDEHRSDKSLGNQKSGHGGGKQRGATIALNLLLRAPISSSQIEVLEKHGDVLDKFSKINVITFRTTTDEVPFITSLDFIRGLNEDSIRQATPIVESIASSSADGESTWNLDMINVSDGVGASTKRETAFTGSGVYVAVLDTGLVKNWPYYFGTSIASEYAAAFGGGGGEKGNVSTQPDKWELDQDSHGTHVTSTIVGYNYPGRKIMGVAPDAKVIPVKVLGQQGSGWSSVIARGIMYVAELKEGPLKNSSVVINMSLGGPTLDVMEKAAIDYAISKGVIIVASAGNSGTAGMGYPGAYPPVISVAAVGWTGEWQTLSSNQRWWRSVDLPEDGSASAYITDFSSRQKQDQELDIAAPGSWVVGPYQTNGQLNWYFLGGTSMAAPHVTGVVALLAQKNPAINQNQAESKIKLSAAKFNHSSTSVLSPSGAPVNYSWGSDATGAGLLDAKAALSLP